MHIHRYNRGVIRDMPKAPERPPASPDDDAAEDAVAADGENAAEIVKPRWQPGVFRVPAYKGQGPAAGDNADVQGQRILGRGHKLYYDAAADAAARSAYYPSLEGKGPAQAYSTLSELVTTSHHSLPYDPDTYLYPWVDLRPNLRLQSIYVDQPIPNDEPVRVACDRDFRYRAEIRGVGQPLAKVKKGAANRSLKDQAAQWVRALQSCPTDALAIAQKIAQIEVRNYFNCEHVVPQIWFEKEGTPRGDLHHLFALEADLNGARGSKRLHEFGKTGGEGYADYADFQPPGGKGPAARATLYFLLRYPGEIGNRADEATPADLDTLLRWNRENPPSLWERHRNQAIQELQGNRNPFIDHPEWADQVDFTSAFSALAPTPPASPSLETAN